MNRFEKEFNDRLEALGQDSRSCARFTYTLATLDHIVGSDPDLLSRINEHPNFWNGVGGGLQAATFVALGRIYDSDSGTRSAAELLRHAKKWPGIFSRRALEARKVGEGLSAADAKAYAAEAFELPKSGGLVALEKAFGVKQRFYRDKAKRIRDEVFAHSGMITPEERSAFFAGLFLRQFWDLAVFPLRLHEALWQLYRNGRQPDLPETPTIIGRVLEDLPAAHTSAMEHRDTARDTAKFLEWLKALKDADD